MATDSVTLTAIGCSGAVTEIFVNGFLQRGINLRILARNPTSVTSRYPGVHVVPGSMMNPENVATALKGADAAFVVTPMGLRNNPAAEIKAVKSIIEGAKKSPVKHLIYTSVLGADKLRGVGLLDAKVTTEKLFSNSGIPHSILRCGSYMEDVFDLRLPLLNKGKFLFPVTKKRRFSYTCQEDVARFVVDELLKKKQTLTEPLNFITPGDLSINEVEKLLTKASGISIKTADKFPTYYLFLMLLPYFYLTGHRFSSIIPLIRYFDQHGYTDSGKTVGDLFPDFHMTSLQEHLGKLWL